jgi:hypothetical protein
VKDLFIGGDPLASSQSTKYLMYTVLLQTRQTSFATGFMAGTQISV